MIPTFDHVVDPQVLERTVAHFRQRGIVLPTFAQMRDPSKVPASIRAKLATTGLWDRKPENLFRITWKNEPVERGGGYGPVNALEIPSSLSGVPARIVLLLGKWFPTGAHKVGAAYGCLVPRIVTGQFDPTYHRAVWPSTGNYCRGGAFDSFLMGCTAVAILPEQMSRERFDWLAEIGAEVIATPGCESNVKEIYDKCHEIRATRPECVIFNQFDEFGNPAWHRQVTGPAIAEAFAQGAGEGARLAAFISATGSAGTIGAGDFLKKIHPHLKIVAAEAKQCPTLYQNGFGAHRIEGIGDKHVPWVHNARNTDAVAAIDDEDSMRLLRLFNEPAGRRHLAESGVPEALIARLGEIGISGAANLIAAVWTARHFEMDERDTVVTIATDSAAMYDSRRQELTAEYGPYEEKHAARDFERCLFRTEPGAFRELTYEGRKAIHNLKYYTWVEQQGKEIADLNRLWYDRDFWDGLDTQASRWDELIDEFNRRTGLLPQD